MPFFFHNTMQDHQNKNYPSGNVERTQSSGNEAQIPSCSSETCKNSERIKVGKYRLLTKQIAALIEGEHDEIAVMANVCAAIHEAMGFFWTGFYRVSGEELVLGPFQGPVACTHIGFGRGVCGTSWKERQSIVVPDVEAFPGHIACSSLSRSEIVVPVLSADGTVRAVLDIDSKQLATFDDVDRQFLEDICKMIASLLCV